MSTLVLASFNFAADLDANIPTLYGQTKDQTNDPPHRRPPINNRELASLAPSDQRERWHRIALGQCPCRCVRSGVELQLPRSKTGLLLECCFPSSQVVAIDDAQKLKLEMIAARTRARSRADLLSLACLCAVRVVAVLCRCPIALILSPNL